MVDHRVGRIGQRSPRGLDMPQSTIQRAKATYAVAHLSGLSVARYHDSAVGRKNRVNHQLQPAAPSVPQPASSLHMPVRHKATIAPRTRFVGQSLGGLVRQLVPLHRRQSRILKMGGSCPMQRPTALIDLLTNLPSPVLRLRTALRTAVYTSANFSIRPNWSKVCLRKWHHDFYDA